MVSRNTTLVPSLGLRIGPACEAGLSAGMGRERVPPQIRNKEDKIHSNSQFFTRKHFCTFLHCKVCVLFQWFTPRQSSRLHWKPWLPQIPIMSALEALVHVRASDVVWLHTGSLLLSLQFKTHEDAILDGFLQKTALPLIEAASAPAAAHLSWNWNETATVRVIVDAAAERSRRLCLSNTPPLHGSTNMLSANTLLLGSRGRLSGKLDETNEL